MLNEKNIYENVELMPADLRGWNSNDNAFEALILKIKPKTIIEVGSWKGASAINMAQICKKIIYKHKYSVLIHGLEL